MKKIIMGSGLELSVIAAFFLFALLSDSPKDLPVLGPDYECPFRQATGYSCFGCGMTRAVIALAHFRVIEALKFNAMVFFLYIFMFYWLGQVLTSIIMGKYFVLRNPRRFTYFLCAVFITFGLGRLILELTGVLSPI